MAGDTYGRFYLHPQKQADGQYQDVIYVEIFIKGDKNTSFSRPKKDEDETTYPNGWKAFVSGQPSITEGNPVGMLPGIGPSEAMNLNAVGIMSIEDLAELDEAGVEKLKNGRTLTKRAKAYLAALQEKDEEEAPEEPPVDVEALQNDPTVQQAPAVKKKRGRPRKTQEA